MLVLTRKAGESIVIIVPGHEPIEVVSLSPGRRQIGVKAPAEVRVMRKEKVTAPELRRAG